MTRKFLEVAFWLVGCLGIGTIDASAIAAVWEHRWRLHNLPIHLGLSGLTIMGTAVFIGWCWDQVEKDEAEDDT